MPARDITPWHCLLYLSSLRSRLLPVQLSPFRDSKKNITMCTVTLLIQIVMTVTICTLNCQTLAHVGAIRVLFEEWRVFIIGGHYSLIALRQFLRNLCHIKYKSYLQTPTWLPKTVKIYFCCASFLACWVFKPVYAAGYAKRANTLFAPLKIQRLQQMQMYPQRGHQGLLGVMKPSPRLRHRDTALWILVGPYPFPKPINGHFRIKNAYIVGLPLFFSSLVFGDLLIYAQNRSGHIDVYAVSKPASGLEPLSCKASQRPLER